jgi:Holliday junction resolvase RusA-like endonuclease
MLEKETEWFTIDVTPRQADRARANPKTGTFYNTPEYARYKKTLIMLFKGRNLSVSGQKILGVSIPKEDYYGIEAIFYFPYPKSTPKYKLIEGEKKRTKPDIDNVGKALQDSLEQAKAVVNDSLFSDINYKKRFTIEKEGRIKFKLYYESNRKDN